MSDIAKYTKELRKLFDESDDILLICHINPDGDAIGSELAVYHYLTASGKNVSMISPNYLQDFLKWMDGADLINIYIKDTKRCNELIRKADLILLLDFNQPDRLGKAKDQVMQSGAKKVIIDHHLDPHDFVDLIISEPSRCSTSEIVYELVSDLNNEKFNQLSYAEAIYVGIVTDTGNFEHGSYTPRTYRIIADLLESGLEKDKILNLIYKNFSADRVRLLGYALSERMVILPEYGTAYIYLTRDDLRKHNYVKGDTEGFVNTPLSIKGIIFSAFFVEKDGHVKLSFRSRGAYASNEFAARYFSGGGHLNASGGEYYGSLDDAIEYFLKVVKENRWRFEDDN